MNARVRAGLAALALGAAAGPGLAADAPLPPCALPPLPGFPPPVAAWKPMGGTAAASEERLDGRTVVRFPCNFAGTDFDRASWDLAVDLDLTACSGIRFDLHCADASPVDHFVLYLRSGQGWYAASFGPGRGSGWSEVVIRKWDVRIEGSPRGWGTIETIRISAWRGADTDTAFSIANLALAGADAPVVVIRGDSALAADAGEGDAVRTYSRSVEEALDGLGLEYLVLSDLEVTGDSLKGRRVAVLPFNPQMPPALSDALARFLDGGGKLVAFYILPAELSGRIGIRPGDHVKRTRAGQFASIRPVGGGLPGLPASVGQASWNICRGVPVEGRSRVAAEWYDDTARPAGEPALLVSSNAAFMTHVLLDGSREDPQRLVLSVLAHLDGSLRQTVMEKRLAGIGAFGPYRGFDEALRGIRSDAGGDARPLRWAEEAEARHGEARQAMHDGDFARFQEAGDAARESVLLAHCAAQKPQLGEHRAWWCHSAFGVEGMTWDQAVANLATNGFTAILPNMLWGGAAFYESGVLPVAAAAKAKGDQLAACVAACRKHGIECHVWKVNWNMGWCAPPEFMERMRREGRTQVGYDGTPEPRWLCPSHPANRQLEVDAMVEVATKYDVDGIHFDYIRYPGGDHCFCPGCRERFEAVLGGAVADWPAATRGRGPVRQAWLDFRRDNITKVVAAVHEAVKERKPSVKISAAVFSNWTSDRDGVGQDWKLWCERGYLDFVCPMDYTRDSERFASLVRRQLAWAGSVPCYPGIGLSVWGRGEPDMAELIGQIGIARRLGAGGFTIFNYGEREAARAAPLCGLGITRRE